MTTLYEIRYLSFIFTKIMMMMMIMMMIIIMQMITIS